MSGIQLPVGVDTVNPVDADYKRGPWPTIAAALAAIDLAVRYNNLSFYVVGDPNEYYWLDTDLSDSGLLIRSSSGGGSLLPIVRYVYLVQDASDATLMGGVASNVYTTFQNAYNAANVLQVVLGGTNKVVIKVGNTTAATVGNIVLAADWNIHISISGNSSATSVLGNITLSNALGTGYNFGTATAINLSNVTVGNIITTATGATGNGGTINISMTSSKVGNLISNPTNATNSAGNSGAITIQSTSYSTCQTGDIRNGLFSATSTGTTGAIVISGLGRVKTGAIRLGLTQYPGSAGGALTLTNVDAGVTNRYTYQNISITNCTFSSDVVFNDVSVSLTSNITISLEDVKIAGGLASGVNTGGSPLNIFVKNSICAGLYFEGINYLEVFNSTVNNSLGNAMELIDCKWVRILQSSLSSIDNYIGPISGSFPVIYTADNTSILVLTILNCSLLGGTNSVASLVPVTIFSGASYYEVPKDANTTITPLALDI